MVIGSCRFGFAVPLFCGLPALRFSPVKLVGTAFPASNGSSAGSMKRQQRSGTTLRQAAAAKVMITQLADEP
jgi:hypothetical protein